MIWRHALKNAILPVVTVIGIEFAFLIGGLVVTETVFNLPGLARFLVQAILWRDYPIVQNLVMFIAIVVIVSNLVVDMLYGVLDPRVRYGKRGRSAVDVPPVSCRARPARGPRSRFCRKKPLGAAGGAIMLVMLLTAVFADQMQTHDPIATDAAQSVAPPNPSTGSAPTTWAATSTRASCTARASRSSSAPASTLLGSVLGGIIGLLSAYIGGKTDLITQRIMDILQGLPLLVLALVMSAALGPSIGNVVLAISIPIIPRAARVIRASVLTIREMQYVEAARAIGLRHLRIAFRHILPNTIGPFIVLGTAQLGGAILVEAALSFLGVGVPEPYPSWGRMLSVSAAEYAQKAPWLVLFPGIAISLAVFGSNLLGDALRDTLEIARSVGPIVAISQFGQRDPTIE